MLLASILVACSDKENPAQSKTDLLADTWELASAREVGDGDVISFSYIFSRDGEVRNRIGGPFLRQLRDIEAVQQALEGEELAQVDLIDGGYINWVGRWTLQGDSLTATYDRLVVEAFGDLPLIGRVAVPVFDQMLDPSAETRLDFTCSLEGDQLSLRGEALSAGVGGETTQVPAAVTGPAGEVVQLVGDFLTEEIRSQGLDTQTFVRD